MKVAWLADKHDGIGGAELTEGEFARAAPEGVEVVQVAPDALEKIEGCEVAVVHNCVNYPGETVHYLPAAKRVIRYHHDLAKHDDPLLRDWLNAGAGHLFCSPLQRKHHEVDGECIPPALDLQRFRVNRQQKRHGTREGNCSVATWLGPGKGAALLAEAVAQFGEIDCYGEGPFKPRGAPGINDCGEVSYDDLPSLLWRYERFIYLPMVIEPFGRAIIEAWLAGCELVINGLVGGRYWIEEAPEKLETAAEDFWEFVLA